MTANGVIGLHHFDNETVQREGYYQMVDTYVQSEGQNFPQNAVFLEDRASPHTTRAVRSLLD